MRSRLSYADLTEWLAERGVHVDRSTLYDWVQHVTPLYDEFMAATGDARTFWPGYIARPAGG